jgi:imidazolonepropionase-like amidohydrolase
MRAGSPVVAIRPGHLLDGNSGQILTNQVVWIAATVGDREMMGWQDRIGSVEKGKFADMIDVSGDPLEDSSELERVKFVMKAGQVVRNDLK